MKYNSKPYLMPIVTKKLLTNENTCNPQCWKTATNF